MNKIVRVVLVLVALSFFLSGCGSGGSDGSVKKAAKLPELTCIAVLPVTLSVSDDVLSVTEKQFLVTGAALLDTVLAEELGGNDRFKVLSEMQLSAMVNDPWAGRIQQLQAVAHASRCDAVMETSISRYRQRVGSTMSVTSPAAAAFSMELVGGEKGTGIWSASFNESQKALTENIFSFKKAESRHFQWITVEQLVRDGMKNRLAHFPYFLNINPENE